MFLSCFIYIAKKESLGECQQSEFPAQVPCRHGRPSSESNSDEDLPEAVDLQVRAQYCYLSQRRMCAVETSLTDLSEVIHVLETEGGEALVFWRGSFYTAKTQFQLQFLALLYDS